MLLNINDLAKQFKEKEVLNIPQLSVSQGEIMGVLGNNGAGKTTLFRLCLDLLKADSGSILIDNQNVSNTDSWKISTGAFLDELFLIDFLTPEEYFYFIGDLYGMSKQKVDAVLNDFVLFMGNEILNQKKYIDKFSKGNKQKIGIIGAMLIRPKLLILDEPFNFLDPSSQIIMKKLLVEYNRTYNTTVLLSSHNVQYVTDICSRIILLESGRIVQDHNMLSYDWSKKEIERYFNKQ